MKKIKQEYKKYLEENNLPIDNNDSEIEDSNYEKEN